jgi:hypothetical protein
LRTSPADSLKKLRFLLDCQLLFKFSNDCYCIKFSVVKIKGFLLISLHLLQKRILRRPYLRRVQVMLFKDYFKQIS